MDYYIIWGFVGRDFPAGEEECAINFGISQSGDGGGCGKMNSMNGNDVEKFDEHATAADATVLEGGGSPLRNERYRDVMGSHSFIQIWSRVSESGAGRSVG